MDGKEEGRIFVGGLSWQTDERKLQEAFDRFGKVVDAQIMLERHTNRHRGFGFVTFEDRRAVDSAIKEMHGADLDGRTISVNKAEPKMNTDDTRYDNGGGRGEYRGGRGDGPPPGNCFECGRPGHWVRDCPSAGGGRSGRFSSKFGGGSGGGRGDRSLGQIGLVIATWMIVMMVVAMGTVIKLTQETGMLGAVIVMPMIATPLVVITLVQTGMEVVQIVMHQVVMVGSEKEATRGMEFVAAAVVAAMIGVAQGVVEAMTGMVHVVVSLIVTAVEDLHAMMEEVTGRGLGLMIVPAGGEDVLMIATDEPIADSSY